MYFIYAILIDLGIILFFIVYNKKLEHSKLLNRILKNDTK